MYIAYYNTKLVWNGKVISMIINREFTVFENKNDWRNRKRLQLLDADDFRRVIFTRADG